MPFVVRNTFDPRYDVKRNWSAWIYPNADTAYGVADLVIGNEPITRDLADVMGIDYQLVCDGYIVNLDDLWKHSEIECRSSFEQLVVQNCGLDIRFNESFQKWQHCHHEGLSCWRLESDTQEGAIAEAASSSYDWYGFGDQTVGSVRYVAAVNETLHIFWCEDVRTEE